MRELQMELIRELWKVFEHLEDFGKLKRELKRELEREMLKSQDICKIVRTNKEQKGEFEIYRERRAGLKEKD